MCVNVAECWCSENVVLWQFGVPAEQKIDKNCRCSSYCDCAYHLSRIAGREGKGRGTFVCPCLFNNDIFDARHGGSSCLINTQKICIYIYIYIYIYMYVYLTPARSLCTVLCKKCCNLHRCYCSLTHRDNRMINSLAQKFSDIFTAATQLNGI